MTFKPSGILNPIKMRIYEDDHLGCYWCSLRRGWICHRIKKPMDLKKFVGGNRLSSYDNSISVLKHCGGGCLDSLILSGRAKKIDPDDKTFVFR